LLVTNTVNGCKSIEIYEVVNGGLKADFVPSTTFGYAPLTVNFINTSQTSTGASSIFCLWSFGNGVVTPTAVLNTLNQSATYLSAGTYSVVLFATKGTCTDSVMKIIRVEIPSKLEVPNIFTPNGDKVNDVFRLIGSSLNEITATIYDRWGNKVYDVTSETGNIGWDGKNLQGKDCPDGTYFYIIKAKGDDGKEFEQKGNVTLLR
jgi:gliding motility-associated-like protein